MLAEDRFQANSPRPFRGFFEWLGDLLPDFDWAPGVRRPAGLARPRGPRRRDRDGAGPARPDAADRHVGGRAGGDRRAATTRARLERLADEAEAAGAFEQALRLRFRAGLLRLDDGGAIDYRPSISTREVSRKLRSEDFDALATTFDDVVYGGRAAEDADVRRRARAGAQVVKR